MISMYLTSQVNHAFDIIILTHFIAWCNKLKNVSIALDRIFVEVYQASKYCMWHLVRCAGYLDPLQNFTARHPD